MKTATILIFGLFLILLSFSCSNDDDGTNSNLPAITESGENTFGCRIDGQVFVPRGSGGFSDGYTSTLSASYGRINYPEEQEGYYLTISARNRKTNKSIGIVLFKSDVPLAENVTYPIQLFEEGNFSADYRFTDFNNSSENSVPVYEFITNQEYNGTITINKLDEQSNIVSGTFEFDCIDESRELISTITDGRFDIIYEILY